MTDVNDVRLSMQRSSGGIELWLLYCATGDVAGLIRERDFPARRRTLRPGITVHVHMKSVRHDWFCVSSANAYGDVRYGAGDFRSKFVENVGRWVSDFRAGRYGAAWR